MLLCHVFLALFISQISRAHTTVKLSSTNSGKEQQLAALSKKLAESPVNVLKIAKQKVAALWRNITDQ
ncbi:hypothetical protein NQ315_000235, partial [Exocentrus adspersus]